MTEAKKKKKEDKIHQKGRIKMKRGKYFPGLNTSSAAHYYSTTNI